MKLDRFIALGLFVGACSTAPILADEAEDTVEAPGWLKKDFQEFSTLLAGRWDNERHRFFAEAAGVEGETLAPHVHIEITASEETNNEEIYAFSSVDQKSETPNTALSHEIRISEDKMSITHSILNSETEGDGCVINWSRRGDQFEGTGTGASCSEYFGQSRELKNTTISTTLSDSEFWISTQIDNTIVETRMRKARPFECWAAVLRGVEHGDSGKGINDWYFKRGVKIHDQGGVAELETDENPARKIRLRLRDVDWTYGNNRPSLTLYIMEGEDDRAVSYAWAEGGANRIGINLRWIQLSCTNQEK